jgi:hypothetical protein
MAGSLRCTMAFAPWLVLGLSPGTELQQTNKFGTPQAKSTGTRKLKRAVIPLQSDIKRAHESNNEFRLLVFTQGVECSHCVEQLRGLLRAARGKADAEILAVSSRPVADGNKALQILGMAASDRFHLLVWANLRFVCI